MKIETEALTSKVRVAIKMTTLTQKYSTLIESPAQPHSALYKKDFQRYLRTETE